MKDVHGPQELFWDSRLISTALHHPFLPPFPPLVHLDHPISGIGHRGEIQIYGRELEPLVKRIQKNECLTS